MDDDEIANPGAGLLAEAAFVLLDEAELALPVAEDVVVETQGGSGAFWQAPPLEDLVSDIAGEGAAAAAIARLTEADAAPDPAQASAPAHEFPALNLSFAPPAVIVVDDGSGGGPFVA